ncbi:MAG TPA: hypothetical protein VML54_12600 [Candidatus Limnocylindrales bacterium]|nr:hypothetical protein [Candidatus Limnocylindrales bacterium]
MNLILDVDVHTVTHVLLADGWHTIAPGSFAIGELVFVVKNGRLVGPDLGKQGVQWREHDDSLITCPLPAVLALKSAGG